jgi:hypothetical protein
VVEDLARPLGRSIEETAEAIIRIAVSGMYTDVSALVSRFGIDLDHGAGLVAVDGDGGVADLGEADEAERREGVGDRRPGPPRRSSASRSRGCTPTSAPWCRASASTRGSSPASERAGEVLDHGAGLVAVDGDGGVADLGEADEAERREGVHRRQRPGVALRHRPAGVLLPRLRRRRADDGLLPSAVSSMLRPSGRARSSTTARALSRSMVTAA